MKARQTFRLIGVLGLAIILIGCAGQASLLAAPVKTSRVELPPSYRFDPAVIQVAVGTTVTWHNGDNFTHSVSFTNGSYPLLLLKPGDSGSITFSQPGEFDYTCTFHPHDMHGKVIVTVP